jgi:hypothetical protein
VTVGDDVSVAVTFAITTVATRHAAEEHRRNAGRGSVTSRR